LAAGGVIFLPPVSFKAFKHVAMSKLFTLLLILLQQFVFAQGGISWSAPADIAAASFGNLHPRIAVDGAGNPLVIWGNNANNKVYFSRWSNGAFTTPLPLNPASIPVFTASWASPDLAASGDTVYVVYKHTPEDVNHIYLVHSYDGGQNFSAPVRVDYVADSVSRFPAVATDANGNPLVAFMKFDPGFSNARYVVVRSADHGITFSPDVLASRYSGGHVCDCCPATLATSGNKVALLYRDNLDNLRNSWAGISQDNGQTFPSGIQVDKTNWIINACPSSGPDGVVVGDSLYSVFMSGAGGKTRCYFSKSSLNDQQAAASIPLTTNFPGLVQQNFPRIASAGNAVAIAWKQVISGSSEIALYFNPAITTGLPASYEIPAAGEIANVDLILHNGSIFLVWEDEQSGTVKFRQGTYSISRLKEPLPQTILPVYPNPNPGAALTVELGKGNTGPVFYAIHNSQGKVVLENSAQLEDGLLQIDAVSRFPAGIYYLSVQAEDATYSAKFIQY
ncbi:MAG: T9SS type A sorting domain-containing protein, partial [Saprospiraceae bacterium]